MALLKALELAGGGECRLYSQETTATGFVNQLPDLVSFLTRARYHSQRGASLSCPVRAKAWNLDLSISRFS